MEKKNRVFGTDILKYAAVVALGVILYQILDNLSAFWGGVSSFLSILRPLFIGLAIAFLANLPMTFLENKVFAKWKACNLKRLICLFMGLLFIIAIAASTLLLMLPRLFESISGIVENFDSYTGALSSWAEGLWFRLSLPDEITASLLDAASGLISRLDGVLAGALAAAIEFTVDVAGMVISIMLALIIAFYALYGKENLLSQLKRFTRALWSKRRADYIISLASRTNKTLKRYIFGMAAECTLLGLLCFIGMSIFAFPFALLISVSVGVMQMAPVVGPWASAILGALIILVADPPRALWFLIFILVVQQIEANLIYPRVVGSAVGLSGIWVVTAIVLGGGLFGFVGIVLAVPVTAVLYTLLSEWVKVRLFGKKLKEIDGVK